MYVLLSSVTLNSKNTPTIWIIELEKTKFTVTFQWSIKIPHFTIHFCNHTVIRKSLTAIINTTLLHTTNAQWQHENHFLPCLQQAYILFIIGSSSRIRCMQYAILILGNSIKYEPDDPNVEVFLFT